MQVDQIWLVIVKFVGILPRNWAFFQAVQLLRVRVRLLATADFFGIYLQKLTVINGNNFGYFTLSGGPECIVLHYF